MRSYAFALIAAASIAAAAPAGAQQGARADSATALQSRVRQRLAAVVKQRLKLTDDQMRQLTAVNGAYETKRRALVAQERDARTIVRTELQRGQQADQKRVEGALTDLFRTQRARLDLAEQEQRDLAKFLQPSQRAGYLALEEQVRRRIDEMRRGRSQGGPGARRQGGPGGPR